MKLVSTEDLCTIVASGAYQTMGADELRWTLKLWYAGLEPGLTTLMGVPGDRPVSPDFETFKNAYPKRSGTQPWPAAFQVYLRLRREGVMGETILKGAEGYKRYCDAAGKTKTELVMQARTFLNQRQFEVDWTADIQGARMALHRGLYAGQAQPSAELPKTPQQLREDAMTSAKNGRKRP